VASGNPDQVQRGSNPEDDYVVININDASFAKASALPIVPDGKLAELPLPLRSWEDFERLTAALAADVDDLVEVRRYGTGGQSQYGVDVVGFTRLGRQANAYQCKNVTEFNEQDLSKALKKFLNERRPFAPKRLVVAVATNANRTQLIEALVEAQDSNPDVVLEFWDAPKINDLLRTRPQVVERFFGEDAARRFCLSTSFPPSTSSQPTAAAGGISLEVIMRGPLRSLELDASFDEAVAHEQNDPGSSASTYAGIATRLTAEGFEGHAWALRRRAVQAYSAAGMYAEALRLQLAIIAATIMAGRWQEVQGPLWVARQIVSDSVSAGRDEDAAMVAAISILDAASDVLNDPLLAETTVNAALGAAAQHLTNLLEQLPVDPSDTGAVLLAAGTAASAMAECAIATLAFGEVAAVSDTLNRASAALAAAADTNLRHLGLRLRLAVAEAGSPFARDGSDWQQLQDEATSWQLNDQDAALVLARYARARANDGAASDADAAWRRAAEFGSRAQLFTDIAGWLSAQVQLRNRYGPSDTAELTNMRQMILLLNEQPSARLVPIGGLRAEVLDALRRRDGLRSAALAAQRLRVLAAAGGLWEDEIEAHSLLGDVFERSDEPHLSVFHRIQAGELDAAKEVAARAEGIFLNVTSQLEQADPNRRAAAYAVIAAQDDLVPDELVDLIGERIASDVEPLVSGTFTGTASAGMGLLQNAVSAAAVLAGRLSPHLANRVVSALDQRLNAPKGTVSWTDQSHLRILVSVAASGDNANAAAAFDRISQLLALDSPALRTSGRELAQAVKRHPDDVRQILVALAKEGNESAAEVLAGWSLTGEAGRHATRDPNLQAAWDAALPFAEAALERLASAPPGTPGSASLIISFIGDASLVTILDPADIDRALTGLLRVASDRLHLAPTRQQALDGATILVAGQTGDRLGADRLAEVFRLACEYARGQHDGSAMDDLTQSSHPLSSWQINIGDATLAADGISLAARASRTPEEQAAVLEIATQIVRNQPSEEVLNGVAHSIAALRSLADAPATMSITALAGAPSEPIRAVGAMYWALVHAPADGETDADELGDSLAHDPSPLVRRSLAEQIAIVTSDGRGLSAAGRNAAEILSRDTRWGIRNAALEALVPRPDA